MKGTASPAGYAHASLAIANLRGLFILILVSFHACLAYLGSTPPPGAFDQPPFLWLAFPIVDSHRFFGFDLYCAWEDVHVMALMFFLSGLFVVPSLKRKGAWRFAADRLLRLGPPFLFSVAVLMPIAIYPVYLQRNPSGSLAGYLAAYRNLPFVPNGPTWFLWLLLAISVAMAALYAIWPRGLDALARLAGDARRRPQRFLAMLAAGAALGYLPLTLAYGPFDWFEHGPVSFQISRPLLYAVFYFAGAAVGAAGLGEGLLAPDGELSRHWRRLCVASPAFLFVWMGLTGVTLTFPAFAPMTMRLLSGLAYVGASVAGVMLLMAVSVRFCALRLRWLEPLSRNALGVFVVHYAPLVWMQYALIDLPLPALVKAALVFGVTLPVSLALALAMRRLPLLARLLGEEPGAAPRPANMPQRAS
ncbi:MAG: acyltransferase [Pseudomonadota bacterium]|nr:acyltransferase [Pseudomonadota bacterium]